MKQMFENQGNEFNDMRNVFLERWAKSETIGACSLFETQQDKDCKAALMPQGWQTSFLEALDKL